VALSDQIRCPLRRVLPVVNGEFAERYLGRRTYSQADQTELLTNRLHGKLLKCRPFRWAGRLSVLPDHWAPPERVGITAECHAQIGHRSEARSRAGIGSGADLGCKARESLGARAHRARSPDCSALTVRNLRSANRNTCPSSAASHRLRELIALARTKGWFEEVRAIHRAVAHLEEVSMCKLVVPEEVTT